MCKKQSKILEALCIIKEGNKFEQVRANLFHVIVLWDYQWSVEYSACCRWQESSAKTRRVWEVN